MEEELKRYGLKVYWAEAEDRDPIDFSIADEEDNVAWVWGDREDIEWECNHPYQCVDFGDGEEQGECLLCGGTCDYHYEEDEAGNKVPEPHEWYSPKRASGLIKEYVKELQEGQ